MNIDDADLPTTQDLTDQESADASSNISINLSRNKSDDDPEEYQEFDLDNLDLIPTSDIIEEQSDQSDEYDQIYDNQEIIGLYFDILDSYYNHKKKPDIIQSLANEFYSIQHGENHQFSRTISKKPSLHLLQSKMFSETYFVPIVSDKKKYYTNAQEDMNNMTDSFKQFAFIPFLDPSQQSNNISELAVEELLVKKYYKNSGISSGFNYRDYYKQKYTGGYINDNTDDPEDDDDKYFNPLRLNYISKNDNEMDKSYITINLPHETILFRDCINNKCIEDPFNSETKHINFVQRTSTEYQ